MDETLDTARPAPPASIEEKPEPVDVTVAAIARTLSERDSGLFLGFAFETFLSHQSYLVVCLHGALL